MELVLGLLTFVAFVIRVVTGFGSAIFLSPVFSNIFQPKEAVVLIILLESFINIIFVLRERLKIALREVYLGAFSGIAGGIVFFDILSQEIVGLIIGSGMAILATLVLIGVRIRVKRDKGFFITLGFLSGAMGVLTGVNGPQIVLGLTNQGYSATFIRSFMITYFVIIDTATLAAFFAFGYIQTSTLKKFAILAPFVAASYITGRRIVGNIEAETLQKLMLAIVLILSILLIARYGGVVFGSL